MPIYIDFIAGTPYKYCFFLLSFIYCLFNATINGPHLHGPDLCFRFQNDKKKIKKIKQDKLLLYSTAGCLCHDKRENIASSIRSWAVYGACIPSALSKAVGYPKFLLSLRNLIHERRQKYQRGWLYGHTNKLLFLTWMSENKICAGKGGHIPG